MNSTNTILKWIALITLTAVLITPLIVANSLFFPFIVGKALWLRLFITIGFGAWAILAIRDNSYLPKKNSTLIATTILVVFTLISAFFAENPTKAFFSNFERMEGFFAILHLYMYYIALSSLFKTAQEWRRYFAFSLGVAAFVCFKGLMQLAGLAEINQSDTRLDATLGNAAYLAVYMVVHIYLALYMLVGTVRKNIWTYLGYAFLMVNFCTVLFFTATRGSMIGFVVGAMIAGLCYIYFDRNEEKNNVYRYSVIGVLVLICLFVGSLFAIRTTGIVQLPPLLERYTSISWNENKSQARGYIWPIAMRGVADKPVFGWGQEGFNYVFNTYYVQDLWRHEQWFDRAHNVFLDWLVAGGFLGFLAYISLYFLIVKNIVATATLTGGEKSALIGLLVGYAIHNVFVFDNNSSYLLFFMLIAYTSYLAGGKELTEVATVTQQKDIQELVITPTIIVLLCVLLFFTVVSPLHANQTLMRGMYSCHIGEPNSEFFIKAASQSSVAEQEVREQFLVCANGIVGSATLSQDKQRAIVQSAVDLMYEQIALTPRDARPYILLASSLNRLGQAEQALQLLETAEKLTPQKPSVILEKAVSHMILEQYALGTVEAKRVYELYPEYSEARAMYALTLIFSGKINEAEAILAKYDAVRIDRRIIGALISGSYYVIAEKSLEEKLKLAPNDIDSRFILAGVSLLRNNRSKALVQVNYVLENGSAADKTKAENIIKEINLGRNPIKLK